MNCSPCKQDKSDYGRAKEPIVDSTLNNWKYLKHFEKPEGI